MLQTTGRKQINKHEGKRHEPPLTPLLFFHLSSHPLPCLSLPSLPLLAQTGYIWSCAASVCMRAGSRREVTTTRGACDGRCGAVGSGIMSIALSRWNVVWCWCWCWLASCAARPLGEGWPDQEAGAGLFAAAERKARSSRATTTTDTTTPMAAFAPVLMPPSEDELELLPLEAALLLAPGPPPSVGLGLRLRLGLEADGAVAGDKVGAETGADTGAGTGTMPAHGVAAAGVLQLSVVHSRRPAYVVGSWRID